MTSAYVMSTCLDFCHLDDLFLNIFNSTGLVLGKLPPWVGPKGDLDRSSAPCFVKRNGNTIFGQLIMIFWGGRGEGLVFMHLLSYSVRTRAEEC